LFVPQRTPFTSDTHTKLRPAFRSLDTLVTFGSNLQTAAAAAMPPKKADEGEQKGAARFGRVKNNLKMGLLGLPNVGKSSLFNLLTEQVILGHLSQHSSGVQLCLTVAELVIYCCLHDD
jgi:ribosome biogenesis GTPase A